MCERVDVCVLCVCGREGVSIGERGCVCVFVVESVCVSGREGVCVWTRERAVCVGERVCVCVGERGCVCERVCGREGVFERWCV